LFGYSRKWLQRFSGELLNILYFPVLSGDLVSSL